MVYETLAIPVVVLRIHTKRPTDRVAPGQFETGPFRCRPYHGRDSTSARRPDGSQITVAEVLDEAGYTTGCIGKWDMSKRRYQELLVPNAQGFDHYFGPLGANDANRVTLWRDRHELETTSDMASLTRLYTVGRMF